MGTTEGFPPGWSVAAAGPWRVHRRWVTSLGRETVGRRMRRRILGAAAPGMEVDEISFDLEDLVLKLLGWIVKLVLILVVVPIVLVLVLVVGLLETLVRVVLRRSWAVDGFGRDGTHVRWRAPGAVAARRRRDENREALAAGAAPLGGDIKAGPTRG